MWNGNLWCITILNETYTFALNAFWEEVCHIEMEDQLIALVQAM